MVQAIPLHGAQPYDYSAYGDYLLVSDDSEVRQRVDSAGLAMRPWFELLKRRFNSPVVLDFGSGAGYLAKAAEDFGFESFGIEISAKLVEFSKQKVKFSNVYGNLEDVATQFDGIFMTDVIEHLDPARSRTIMTTLLELLKPGGLLIGNTPNIHSANILICKARDPVVAPPSHLCYFSPNTVDLYLQSLGLTREKLYSQGLSSDSFFRKSKFEPSFLEKSWRQQRSLFAAVGTAFLQRAFGAGGRLVRLLGLGYQIYFAYSKTTASTTFRARPRLDS
jgi:SAM-dependent methyltransferase